MAKQEINIGVEGNDGTGDSIRESFRKVNENFTELYAVFGQGGSINFTDLGDTPPQSDSVDGTGLVQNPSTSTRPVIPVVNVAAEGSKLEFRKLVSEGFLSTAQAPETDSITFDLSLDGYVILRNVKSTLKDDDKPTLKAGTGLNLTDNVIAGSPTTEEEMQDALDNLNTLHSTGNTYTLDNVLINKGFADTNYLKNTGGSTGSLLRIRREGNISVEDYTFTITNFISGNASIASHTKDGVVIGGGHGLDSASNGLAFNYATTGNSAETENQVAVNTLNPLYIRVVDEQKLSFHPTANDATNNTNRYVLSGGTGTQSITDAFYKPDDLSGLFLSNEAMPREAVVRRQGDSMTGDLYLNDHPGELAGSGTPNGIEDLQAATKFYVDNTSYASNVNLYVSLSGNDVQRATPAGKEGRSLAYAFKTVNRACRKAEEIIEASPVEPGNYLQTIVWENGEGTEDYIDTFVRSAGFTGGPQPYPSATASEGDETIYEFLFRANKQFVIEEAIAYINNLIETADEDSIYFNFSYNEDTCRRDLGLILDSILLDSQGGISTNKLSRQAGLRYFKNASGRVAIGPQKQQTLDTINRARLVLLAVLENQAVSAINTETTQTFDPNSIDAPEAARDVVGLRFDDITGIIANGLDSAPSLVEGRTYTITFDNGGAANVIQGDPTNIDLIPGKVIVGKKTGSIGRIVQYNQGGQGSTADSAELILEEPIEFIARTPVDGGADPVPNFEPGDGLEYGNRVSNTNITIFVESGIFYEDYPIKVPANVSIVGDEFRRTHIRPKRRVSQSKYASTYMFRDRYFNELDIHDHKIATTGEIKLTLDSNVNVRRGDVITQSNNSGARGYVQEDATNSQELVVLYDDGYVPSAGIWASFTYDETLYETEIAEIVDAVRFDLAFGSNYRSISTALRYLSTSSTFGQPPQKEQTLATIGRAKDLTAAEITNSALANTSNNLFDEVIDIVSRGQSAADTYVYPTPTGGSNNASNSGIADGVQQILANKDFITQELIAWINVQIAGGIAPFATDFTYSSDKCARDTGLILDALVYDLTYGGNLQTIQAAKAYFVDGVAQYGDGQLDETVAAYGRLKTIVGEVIIESAVTVSSGNNLAQDTSNAAGSNTAKTTAETRIQEIVNNLLGGGNALPTRIDPDVTWTGAAQQATVTELDPTAQATIASDTTDWIDLQIAATPSTNFDTTNTLIIDGVGSAVTPTAIETTYLKESNIGFLYASDTRRPVSNGRNIVENNLGGYENAAEIMKQNKEAIQDEIIAYIDFEATQDFNQDFGEWIEVTLTLSGNITVAKGDVLTQEVTSASGVVKDDVDNDNVVTIVGPTDVFDTINNRSLEDADGNVIANSAVQSFTKQKINDTFGSKCRRDVGLIVDAIIHDLDEGGNDQVLEAQGKYYEGAVEVGQESLTVQAITHIGTVASFLLNPGVTLVPNPTYQAGGTSVWETNHPTAEAGTGPIVNQMVQTVVYAFNSNYNPAKNNLDMDVFLMNDQTILRNLSVQGHGGFLCVLDPEGQILTKSPYIQTGSSFSQSINKHAFRGGMFVDGFVGNIPLEIVSKVDGNAFRLYARSHRDQRQANGVDDPAATNGIGQGLFQRRPEVPAPFYVDGKRYQVNSIVNHDPLTGTCELILDANSNKDKDTGVPLGWDEKDRFPIILQTAGNRSMLGNDFTQVNDLGYGLLVTNTGLSEMVSMFTYYCHAAYYANNGSEIRSLNGSNAYGNFGLVASGADPNEIPQTGSLKYPTVQTAKAYVNPGLQASAIQNQSFMYIYDTDHIPIPEGEMDIIFTERKTVSSINNSGSGDDAELTIEGHGFIDGQNITIEGATPDTTLNGNYVVTVIDSATISLNGVPGNTFSGATNIGGVVKAYDRYNQGTELRKYEVVSVTPAYQSDNIPAVGEKKGDLGVGNVLAQNYEAELTQPDNPNNPVGYVTRANTRLNPDSTEGSRYVYYSQPTSSAAFNTTDEIYIEGNATGYTFADIDVENGSLDTSGLGSTLIGGKGTVWRISFSNQSQDGTVATGGLQQELFGSETVTLRQRAKFVLNNVETVPIRPSTAVVFEENALKTYRSINFDTTSITDFNGDGESDLPRGENLLTFDTNYQYILQNVNYDNYDAEYRITFDAPITGAGSSLTIPAGSTITQQSGASAVTKTGGTNVEELILTDWNGTPFTVGEGTGFELSYTEPGGSPIVIPGSGPDAVYDLTQGANKTFGGTAGDILVGIGSVTAAATRARLNEGDMVFGWKDRVHTIVAYHDGDGNYVGNPDPSNVIQTGFPYLEIDPTPRTNKTTLSTAPATGLAYPLVVDNENDNVILSIGVPEDEGAEITVNISLCRATGHDFSNIGTGGYNTSNYPNVIFGSPASEKTAVVTNEESAIKAQVWERDKGRVFFASTDEDGFFRIGKFFTVDQGTGTVTFAAQIAISGLDGLGFRDGETISKFSADTSMTQESNQIVPTEFAIVNYVNRRLGYDKNMTRTAAPIGEGFLPQLNPVLTANIDPQGNPTHALNMSNGRLTLLGAPVQGSDGTNKKYVDERIFANDEFEDLKNVEFNEVDAANSFGANDLIVMTGNKRVYVKNIAGQGSFQVGEIITGRTTPSAGLISDLENKELDIIDPNTSTNVTVTVVSYRLLEQTLIRLSAGAISVNRYDTVKQTQGDGTVVTAKVLWPQSSTSYDGGTNKTGSQEIIVYDVQGGTFTDDIPTDVLTVTDSGTGTVTATTVYPQTVGSDPGVENLFTAQGSIQDFENEIIEDRNGVDKQTTSGVDGAPVTTMLEVANASERLDGAPGDDTRSDINVTVRRLENKVDINFQYQEESLLDKDVNTRADIKQEKLDMNNAPVLDDSSNLVDPTVEGQRIKQSNQGIAAFDGSTFAEDQLWTLSGNISAQAGDILEQGTTNPKKVAYVVAATSNNQVKVRTASTFIVGPGTGNDNQLTLKTFDETYDRISNTVALTSSGAPVTISNILNTGYINIKDRGITFDKIQDIPEKTVIGRSNIVQDNTDGITEAVPFSVIVDEGGALQDGDFLASTNTEADGKILTLNREVTVYNGETVTQSGTGATGTVQGNVETETKIPLINVTGAFNATGSLTASGSPANGVGSRTLVDSTNTNAIPTGDATVADLEGSALIKVSEGVYGVTPVTKNGASNSLVRTLDNNDQNGLTNVSRTTSGMINVKGLIIDSRMALDVIDNKLTVFTPNDYVALEIEGQDPTTLGDDVAYKTDRSTVTVSNGSLILGSTTVENTDTYSGYSSSINANATEDQFLFAPWIYTHFIQSPGDITAQDGTGIALGEKSSFTGAKQIALVTENQAGILVQNTQVDIGVGGTYYFTQTSGGTTIGNPLTLSGASSTITANAGIIVDNTTWNGDKLDSTSGFEIETAADLVFDTAGNNVKIKDGNDDVYTFQTNTDNTQQTLTTANAFKVVTSGASRDIELAATGNIELDAGADIILDAAGYDVIIKDAGTSRLTFTTDATGNMTVKTNATDKTLTFSGTDGDGDGEDPAGSATINALVINYASLGDATFSNDLDVTTDLRVGGNTTITGDLTVNGSIDLGDSVSADTLEVKAIITGDKLTLKSTSAAADGDAVNADNVNVPEFEFIKDDAEPTEGDLFGRLSFYTKDAADDYQVNAKIEAEVVATTNGSERSDIVIYTSGNGAAFSEGLRIGFTNTTSTNHFVPAADDTYNLGSTGTDGAKWKNVYATTFTGALTGDSTGAHIGDVKSPGGTTVVDVQANAEGDGAPAKFYGIADHADKIKVTASTADDTFNILFRDADADASETDKYAVYEDTDLTYNPNSNTLTAGVFSGSFSGNADTASKVKTTKSTTNATYYATFVDSNNDSATAENVYTGAFLTVNPGATNPELSVNGYIKADQVYITEENAAAQLVLKRQDDTTQNGDDAGVISFQNRMADGTYQNSAQIVGEVTDVNATTGYGKLAFSVNVHGETQTNGLTITGSSTDGGKPAVGIPGSLDVDGDMDIGTTSTTLSISAKVDTNIIPTVDTDNDNAPLKNLGSSTNKWANVYATNFNGTATTATYVTNLKSDASTNLTTDNLTEGTTNLYYTEGRWKDSMDNVSITVTQDGTATGYTKSTNTLSINIPAAPTSVSEATTATTANKVKTNAASGTIYLLGSDNSSAADSEDVYVASGLSYDTATDVLGVTATKARYADLAENYLGDADYEPGTVLVFGGEQEITTTNVKGDRRVAGVVTTNPAHLMNGTLEGDHVVGLALQGRVPCKVIGTVFKGDMLVTSAIPGYAVVDNNPKMGTVIGKAVETKVGDGKGVIEVVVGRL